MKCNYVHGTKSIKVCSHAIYARSCQPFQTGLQLVLPESSNSRTTLERATRAHATAYAYACRAVNSACTQKRVFRIHTSRHYTRARTYTFGRYNMSKVACQTGIICNAAVVVVVGLNYIVTLPGCSSLFHSLSRPVFFSPASSLSVFSLLSFSRKSVLRVFPPLLSSTAPRSTL